jgi:alkyl sulfatase BDS1-like metallo-beta-lactamase superfamily hydrolase
MADLLALTTRIVDSGVADEPVNRVTQELSELAPGVALVESFSHVVALASDAGLVLFDTSGVHTARRVVESLRRWSTARVHTILYTHGHVDHVGGCGALLEDAAARGYPRPRIVGHENVPARFSRYAATNGYNLAANRRQFGGVRVGELGIGGVEVFLPPATAAPDLTFRDRLELEVGGTRIELRHARGETDDHLFAWIPERRILCAGDFFLWFFPNAGNPQKVQRYPAEWAAALREMAGLGAELLLPAHGLPIAGRERIGRCLADAAAALEHLVRETLLRMNAGLPLDAILHEVRVPDELLARPYLRPLYDEPEFTLRNIWRLYGGWWDGNPASLKPPREAELAAEVAALAGGAGRLAARARELAAAGELRLACSLVELAARAEPASREAHAARAEVYELRRKQELSLMAKGVYAAAARESRAISRADPDAPVV